MEDFTIDVGRVEELQMINDTQELDTIFKKAKSALVNGAVVHLARRNKTDKTIPFDHITTLPDLLTYKTTVYKYIKKNS